MEDNDLLMMAAKAAGIEAGVIHQRPHRRCPEGWTPWNPLADDGDALRLAVALRMNIAIKTLPHAVYVEAYNGQAQSATEPLADVRFKVADEAAATRRAIVRAAAALATAPAA